MNAVRHFTFKPDLRRSFLVPSTLQAEQLSWVWLGQSSFSPQRLAWRWVLDVRVKRCGLPRDGFVIAEPRSHSVKAFSASPEEVGKDTGGTTDPT